MTYRGYYHDQDLGLYYLQSRYYDSVVGRFINVDAYLSTGTGLLGYNMYSYCNNNPVNYVDSDGQNPLLGAAASNPVAFLAVASALLLGLLVEAVVDYEETVDKIEESIDNAKAKIQKQWLLLKVAVEYAFSKVKSKVQNNNKQIYYHCTTLDAAQKIISTGTMTGSQSEGGYIFAWKAIPNAEAIKESGARGSVIVAFTTSAAFENDPAFSDMPHVFRFLPVRSVFPGPIRVENVYIVGG